MCERHFTPHFIIIPDRKQLSRAVLEVFNSGTSLLKSSSDREKNANCAVLRIIRKGKKIVKGSVQNCVAEALNNLFYMQVTNARSHEGIFDVGLPHSVVCGTQSHVLEEADQVQHLIATFDEAADNV